MHKKILIITDNLPEQINGVVTTFKNIEAPALLDGYSIVSLLPGSSYMLIAQATLKLSLPGRGVLARRLKRYLRIIYTSPQRVLLVCSLDFILTSGITVTILAIILNFLNS